MTDTDVLNKQLADVTAVNKRQTRQIQDLEGSIKGLEIDKKTLQQVCEALTDRLDKLEDTLAGDELGQWSFANMRSALSNQALALKWLQGGLSLFGLTTILGIVGYVTGWGDTTSEEFVFLDTYHQLERRVGLMEKQNARWALSIEKVEQQLVLPKVIVDGVEQ